MEMKSTIRILFLEMMTLPHTDYNGKRTFDDVMMICKITEDDHTNDHHHYLRYIVTVIFYNVHLTSRAALEAQRRRLRVHLFSFEYFQRSPTRSMARDDIQ